MKHERFDDPHQPPYMVGLKARIAIVLGALLLLGALGYMAAPAFERAHIPMAGIGVAFFIAILTDVFILPHRVQVIAWVACICIAFGVFLGMLGAS